MAAIDDLLALMDKSREDDSRAPASDSAPVQAQPMVNIKGDEPTPEEFGPIKLLGDKSLTPEGEFARQNMNRAASDLIATRDQYAADKSDAQKKLADQLSKTNDISQMLADAVKSIPRSKPPEDISPYLAKAKGDLDNARKGLNPEDDLVSKAIASFGPGLLGLAVGGNSGYAAGGKAGIESAAAYDKDQTNKKALAIKSYDAAVRQLEGLGKLQEGQGKLLEGQSKIDLEGFKNKIDAMKAAGDLSEKSANLLNQNIDNLINADKSVSESVSTTLGKGVSEVGKAEQDEKDRKNKIQAAIIESKGKNQPSEGERKSSVMYGQATKAEQAYQRMKKDLGYVPSSQNQFYDTIQSLFQSADGNTLMGQLLRKVANPDVKRQIQAELDFLAPTLRYESGAAINAGEYLTNRTRYFPSKGEDAKTIAEHDASRAQALEGLKGASGRATLPEIMQPKAGQLPAKPAPAPQKPATPVQSADTKVIGNQKYIRKDGKWIPTSN